MMAAKARTSVVNRGEKPQRHFPWGVFLAYASSGLTTGIYHGDINCVALREKLRLASRTTGWHAVDEVDLHTRRVVGHTLAHDRWGTYWTLQSAEYTTPSSEVPWDRLRPCEKCVRLPTITPKVCQTCWMVPCECEEER